MAIDFLEFSRSYAQSPSISLEVRRRRSIVLRFLRPDYTLPKKQKTRISSEVQGIKLRITDLQITYDVNVYRSAFLYLTSADKQRWFLDRLKSTTPSVQGIRYLHKDGISRWEQIEEFLSKGKKPSIAAVVEVPPPPVVKNNRVSSVKDQLSLMQGKFGELIVSVGMLEDELIKLRRENTSLQALLEQRDAQKVVQEIAAEQQHAQSAIARLLELAYEFPSFPKLIQLAQEIEMVCKKPKESEGIALLPKISEYHRNSVLRYAKPFLSKFENVPLGVQRQVAKSLQQLTSKNLGPHYAGLMTRKPAVQLSDTPAGSCSSRAGNDFRFTWSCEDNTLTIHTLLLRGDMPYSER